MRPLKEFVRLLLYLMLKKKYKLKIESYVRNVNVRTVSKKEYFFGYYDKSPERQGKILFHEMQEGDKTVKVVIKDIDSGSEHIVAEVPAFNWQMGCRAIWIDEDTVSYNDFNGKDYVCKWYSLSQNAVVRTFDKALQDFSFQGHFFVGVNYQRLCSYTKEYGYYCLPKMTDSEFDNYTNDGIWKVDTISGKSELLISLFSILEFEKEHIKPSGHHFVNHIMMNPNGDSFIFIHRYYVGNTRNDRLILWHNGRLKSLFTGRIHSHYCWLDANHVFGYGDYQGKRGFHSIDIQTNDVTCYPELDAAHPRDGHPTSHGEWIGIDDYPDISRMQSLVLYHTPTKKIVKIGEFFHDLKHKDFSRCDLHPRFSEDGNAIYIDTIYSGKRELCKLNIDFTKII